MAQEQQLETVGVNRTGLMTSSQAERMLENAELDPAGDAADFLRFRA